MSKLDFETLLAAPSKINIIGERELNLRGLKILKIENLILTKDQNQCIDFTDNDILKLGSFPKMVNLTTLLLSNNRICKIEKNLAEYLPNLTHLILSNNSIEQLGDLDPLQDFEWLTHLSLVDNPVSQQEYYRLYLIHRCPKLRILDYRKIKESERLQAHELFSGETGTALALKLSSHTGKVFDPEEESALLQSQKKKATVHSGPSKEEQARIREAIKNAKTLAEIAHLEQQLAGGVVPGR